MCACVCVYIVLHKYSKPTYVCVYEYMYAQLYSAIGYTTKIKNTAKKEKQKVPAFTLIGFAYQWQRRRRFASLLSVYRYIFIILVVVAIVFYLFNYANKMCISQIFANNLFRLPFCHLVNIYIEQLIHIQTCISNMGAV